MRELVNLAPPRDSVGTTHTRNQFGSYSRIGDDNLLASSFHQPRVDEAEEKSRDSGLLFDFRKLEKSFGDWALLFYIGMLALVTIGNAVTVQVLEDYCSINPGQIMFSRSILVLTILIILMKGKGLITYELGHDKEPMIIGALSQSISNVAFVLTLAHLPIASSYALLILVNPLGMLIAKSWKFPYTPDEYAVLGMCFVGITALGHPWQKNQLLGLTFGVLSLVLTSLYEKTRKTLQKPVPFQTMAFISNFFSLFISIPLLFVLHPTFPSYLAIGMHVISAVCSIISLEFMHRITSSLRDHTIHVVFYLYILFGGIADVILRLRPPLFPTLLAAVMLLVAGHYPYNTIILTRAGNILKHGTPQTLLEVEIGGTPGTG